MSLFRNLGHQELMIVKVYFIDRIERDFTFSHLNTSRLNNILNHIQNVKSIGILWFPHLF